MVIPDTGYCVIETFSHREKIVGHRLDIAQHIQYVVLQRLMFLTRRAQIHIDIDQRFSTAAGR